MDPILMKSMAVEFVRRFASTDINKIITVEASGIAPAIMVGYLLELPVVFAKKKTPSTMENMLSTSVYSFTKQRSYSVCVSSDYLKKGDKILFIDDFLARNFSMVAMNSENSAYTWNRWPSLKVSTIAPSK